MKKIYSRCCGIDVHKKLICARFCNGRKDEYRELGGTTKELRSLAQWLKDGKCQMVAMESTGSYWKPVYNTGSVIIRSSQRTIVPNNL